MLARNYCFYYLTVPETENSPEPMRSHTPTMYLQTNLHTLLKRPIHSQSNAAILLCDVIHDGKTE